ncbi:MATE family multidrug resistance protein [Caulobacter ginsengisoli]|uniref:MATE family multidrug resistance protein n=1 Tax=Caulobacter ginsengisoli TaxID=400775 RepID=A0ABU0IR64_9CAUL|nr:MATE family efflux transporter [Caulobacter ginsengisoli]MDQ0464499.1 MATE family multidrug resistance protein [Caulobacter ginsengisoli]
MTGRGDMTAAGLRRAILAIALPATLTGVATALFGMADTWVIGQLGEPVAQGAVELGARFLMALLVVFNFLRSSTVALTAQATGRGDEAAQAAVLTRALAAALLIGTVLLALQPLAVSLGLEMFGARGALVEQARTYVGIRYWGGLPWLINTALTGWLIGRRQLRQVMAVEIGANIVHVLLDVSLVLGLHLGVAGIAVATLTSETLKLAALAVVAARQGPARQALALVRQRATWEAGELLKLLALNRDLFLRTLLLMAANILFARAGAQQGPTVLAANAILLQLFMLGALALDGFESAAQVLTGEALGARDRAAFDRQVRHILAWAGASAAILALIYLIAAPSLAASFSTDPAVIATVRTYAIWAAVLPLVGVASFVFDGVFIGASWTRAMLVSMTAALAAFVAMQIGFQAWGNQGLWLAFSLFFVARAAGQAWLLPGLARRSFG